jgi:hypothetical protein
MLSAGLPRKPSAVEAQHNRQPATMRLPIKSATQPTAKEQSSGLLRLPKLSKGTEKTLLKAFELGLIGNEAD